MGNVKGHIFGIDNTLDEAEPFGDELVTVVHDEDTTDVQLDVVLLLLGLEEIKGSSLGNEKESAELEGAFNGEVLHGEVLLPIVGEGLVESGVLVFGDVLGGSNPDRLHLLLLLGLVFGDLGLILFTLLLLGLLFYDLLW